MLQKLKDFKWGYILIALLFAAVGSVFVFSQGSLQYLSNALGIILLIFGVAYAVLTIADKGRRVSFFLKIFFSVVSIICGIITLVMKENAVDTISSIIALLLIVDASFKLHTAAMSKRYLLFGWWFMTAVAALTIIGAFATLKYIAPTDPALPIVLGITIIIDAVGNFFSAFFVSGYEKCLRDSIYCNIYSNQNPDPFAVPDTDFGDQSEDNSNNV